MEVEYFEPRLLHRSNGDHDKPRFSRDFQDDLEMHRSNDNQEKIDYCRSSESNLYAHHSREYNDYVKTTNAQKTLNSNCWDQSCFNWIRFENENIIDITYILMI